MPDGRKIPMRVRSLVGLIPLFAVTTLDADAIDKMPGFQAAHDVVHQASRRSVRQYRFHYAAWRGRAHAAFAGPSFPPAARAANHAGRKRVPLAARHPRHLALSQGPSVRFASGRPGVPRELRTGGIQHRSVRRKFQLARAGLVSGELPHDRIAAAVPSLFRRRSCRWSFPPGPACR